MTVHLRFAQAQIPLIGVADLRFGEIAGGYLIDSMLTLSAALPPPGGSIVAAQVTLVTLSAALPPPGGSVDLSYDINVWRGVDALRGGAWRVGGGRQADTKVTHQDSARTRIPHASVWRQGQAMLASQRAEHGDTDPRIRPQAVAPARNGAPLSDRHDAAWQVMIMRPRPVTLADWREARALAHAIQAAWQERHRRPRPAPAIPWGVARALPRPWTGPHQVARARPKAWRVPWGEGLDQYGWGGPWMPPPAPPPPYAGCYPPPHTADLAFYQWLETGRHNLKFNCPDRTRYVPRLRSYIVINDVTLIRVADNLALPCLSLSIRLDHESWVCGFQASLPGSALDEVIGDAGSPVELEARINGIVFRLYAEKVGRDRTFGKARLAVHGRGRAAVLDAPYAPLMAYASAPALTARQAAEAALTAAGLPTGWTLDWQLTDWLLPAGLWVHQGSPISALTRIAQAGGGYVQADPELKILHILPHYPVAPWDWVAATPDLILPDSVAVTEGIAWEDKPVYNAVYVSGAQGGILARVKRTGSAGDLIAPMITDDLTSHADAARQRGAAILADTGRQARISLSLPVLPTTGIILPGQLIRYDEGTTHRRGLSRSVNIQAALPKVRQTVEIETHE